MLHEQKTEEDGTKFDLQPPSGCSHPGYARAVRIFRRNLGRSIVVWLIQIALIIVATISLLVAGAIVGLIVFLPTILLSVADLTTAAVVTGIIAGLILLPFLIVAAAVLGTFNHTYWTLAYLSITGTESVPRSGHVV